LATTSALETESASSSSTIIATCASGPTLCPSAGSLWPRPRKSGARHRRTDDSRFTAPRHWYAFNGKPWRNRAVGPDPWSTSPTRPEAVSRNLRSSRGSAFLEATTAPDPGEQADSASEARNVAIPPRNSLRRIQPPEANRLVVDAEMPGGLAGHNDLGGHDRRGATSRRGWGLAGSGFGVGKRPTQLRGGLVARAPALDPQP